MWRHQSRRRATFKDCMCMEELDEQTLDRQHNNSRYFMERIPNNVERAVWDPHPRGYKPLPPSPARAPSIQELCKPSESFTATLRFKASLPWYRSEGMDPREFTEAESKCTACVRVLAAPHGWGGGWGHRGGLELSAAWKEWKLRELYSCWLFSDGPLSPPGHSPFLS